MENINISNIFESCKKESPTPIENIEEYGIFVPSKGKWIETGAPISLIITSLNENSIEFRKKSEQENVSSGPSSVESKSGDLKSVTKEEECSEKTESSSSQDENNEERKLMLYKFKRDQLGIRLESDTHEEEEKQSTQKKGHKRKPSGVQKKDKDGLEIQNVCNNIKKFLKKRPPTAELGQLNQEKGGKPITAEELDPTFLDYDVIEYCTNLVEKIPDALDQEGIYRISGDSVYVKHVWACFILGIINYLEAPNLSQFSPHIITGALKLYLRELKDPLIPFDYYEKFIQVIKEHTKPEQVIPLFKELVQQLSPIVQHSLYILCKHLKLVVEHQSKNLMNYENVSIVFGPTTMRPKVETMETMLDNPLKCQVVSFLVEFYDEIFVELKELPAKGSRSLAPIDPKEQKKQEKLKKEEKKKEKEKKVAPKKPTNPNIYVIEEQEDEEDKKEKEVLKKHKNKVNTKNYNEIMSAFDTEEVNASIMVFLSKYDEDPKAFTKFVSKNQSSEHLLSIIVKLSRILSTQNSKKSSTSVIQNDNLDLDN